MRYKGEVLGKGESSSLRLLFPFCAKSLKNLITNVLQPYLGTQKKKKQGNFSSLCPSLNTR